jgi:hypothetical protein
MSSTQRAGDFSGAFHHRNLNAMLPSTQLTEAFH